MPSGLSMRTEITAGQTSDNVGFDLIMADNLPTPSVLLVDRGYDADRIRETINRRDVPPVIPLSGHRFAMPCRAKDAQVPQKVRWRGPITLVERRFNEFKNARRVATRYDKTAESFLGFIDITSIRLWVCHLST